MINSNWTRWIHASVNKHFDAAKGDYYLALSGQRLDQAGKNNWSELKINGPRIKEISKNFFKVEVDIYIGCSVKLDNDRYEIHKLIGKFQSAMIEIPIFKFGDGDDDDSDQQIGCLVLRDDVPESVDIINWGVVTTDVDSYHSTIESFYKMELHYEAP